MVASKQEKTATTVNSKKMLPLTSTAVFKKTTTQLEVTTPTTPQKIITTPKPPESVLAALVRDQGPQAIGISLASLAYTALGKLACLSQSILSGSGPGPGPVKVH